MVLKTEQGSTAVEVLIGPEVERYSVTGTVITGYVKAQPLRDPQDPHRPITGYFVVDTASQKVSEGLSEEDWKRHLQELGIRMPPALRRPTRW
jgi:hypothetical protein